MKLSNEQRAKVLDAVGKGAHPHVACTAAGLNVDYFYVLRSRAKRGNEEAQRFLDEINAAQARAELEAVEAAHRAVQPMDEVKIVCPHCNEQYVAELEHIAALAMRHEGIQKAKSAAAEVALKTLERRHPKRWSQKVVHTIAEEHDRLLDVVQRVAERLSQPEIFELVLEEYLAGGEGESEASSGSSGQTEGGIH